MKNKKTNRLSRVEKYVQSFSRESPDIRKEIIHKLNDYNTLLDANLVSFEHLALAPIARADEINYKSNTRLLENVKPICPVCQKNDNVRKDGPNKYICSKCKKIFSANYNSISSGTKCDSQTWLKVLNCLFKAISVEETCKYCRISISTYYNIRSRISYAMNKMLEGVKMYGNIQCDNTFIKLSYKGLNLKDEDYPVDSPMYRIDYVPRKSRVRGGHISIEEKSSNLVDIFTGIDDYGHVFARYVCIGSANHRNLQQAVPYSKILTRVPDSEPCEYFLKKNIAETKPGDKTTIVADKEASIAKYVKEIDVNFESHVFHRGNIHRKLTPGAKDIQKVNSLHSRLKKFLQRHNYCSTKYLPMLLTLFEFEENFGTSDEIKIALFEVIAKPGTVTKDTNFSEKFVVPNILVEKIEESGKYIKANLLQAEAAYLYHKYQTDRSIKVADITKRTGIERDDVRRIYKNYASSGMLQKVLEYFDTRNNQGYTKDKKKFDVMQIMFNAYDEMYEYLISHPHEKVSIKNYVEKYNKENGFTFAIQTYYKYFKIIQDKKLRQPFPARKISEKREYSPETRILAENLYKQYVKMIKATASTFIEMDDKVICSVLAKDFGISPFYVQELIMYIKRQRKPPE